MSAITAKYTHTEFCTLFHALFKVHYNLMPNQLCIHACFKMYPSKAKRGLWGKANGSDSKPGKKTRGKDNGLNPNPERSQGGRRMDLTQNPESSQVEILTTNKKASGMVPRYSVHVLC